MKSNNTGNILLVSNYPSDTAYAWWLMEHFWITLAELFERKGRESYLAYPSITTIPQHISAAPVVPVELEVPVTGNVRLPAVGGFIRDHGITSVYLTDRPYFSPQYAGMRLAGMRNIVIHDHTPGDRPPVTGLKGWVKSWRNRTGWMTADRVFCVSELMKTRSITNARVPPRKCTVIQNGIPPVSCDEDNASQLRKELGIPPESFVVCTTGRAHPYKRFDFIVRCADRLRSRIPEHPVVFLLAGDGPALHDLEILVERLHLGTTVRLLGFRSDVRDILCLSDMAFHAALGEGFSLSVLEYMSAGLPVIVPDIPSVRQAIEHDVCGFVYPPDDIDTAVDYILQLAGSRERSMAMGRAAKQLADVTYSLDRCTAEFTAAAESAFSL